MRCVALIALTCLVAGAQTADDAAYRVYLWVSDGTPPATLSRALLAANGITALNAEGPGDAPATKTRALPFYIDHAVPKGLLHVRPETFAAARALWRRQPTIENLARPPCLRDPAALAAARAAIAATGAAFRGLEPDFVSLCDEPSATASIDPLDWCQCPRCRDGLAAWLVGQYGSEERARVAWGAHWPAESRPAAVLTDDARRALFHGIGDGHTVTAWNDTRAYADAAFTDAVAALAVDARRAFPRADVGLLGLDMDAPFGGFDWERLGTSLSVAEVYDWGGARAVARSFLPPHTRFIHTVVPADHVDAITLRHDIWRSFLLGDRGLVLFDAKQFFSATGGTAPSALMTAIAPLLTELAGPSLAEWRRATPLPPQIAIVHSRASLRAEWLLDTRQDGATWINRLASWEHEHGSVARTIESWMALLEDLGLTYRFVAPGAVGRGTAAEGGTSALILPRALALSDADARLIAGAAARQLVIADCQTGLFNAHLEARAQPVLDTLFGITHAPSPAGNTRTLTMPAVTDAWPFRHAAEPGVVASTGVATRALGGVPVLISHEAAQTHTLYLNLQIDSYIDDRLARPDRAAALRAWIGDHLLLSQVRPRIEIVRNADAPPWPIATHVRRLGDDLFVAVEVNVQPGARPVAWDAVRARPSVALRVNLPGTFDVTDVLDGGRALGPRNSLQTEVSVDRPKIFRLHR